MADAAPLTFQEIILRLHGYWSDYGCVMVQPYNTEVGAGIKFPDTDDPEQVVRFLRYRLTITPPNGALKRVQLQVKSGNYGKFDENAPMYFTELVYMGM